MFFGADFSKWNTSPIFAGNDFVILRAGYGKGNVDSKVKEHSRRAKLALCHIGYYYFSYALTPEMGAAEADYCIDIIDKYGSVPDYPIYFDWEADSDRYFKKFKGRAATPDEIRAIAKAFLDRLEERGYYAGIYSNSDYMKRVFNAFGGRYTIWYADWSSKAPSNREGYPSYYHIRQYTDKPHDKDVSYIDFPSIMRKAHLNGF